MFALKLADKSIRRLTATESNEYHPRWSPDGRTIAFQATKRGLTDRETTMEDTHVWVMNADGTGRRDLGAAIDNRQGAPQWTPDGSARAVHRAGTRQRAALSRAGASAAAASPRSLVNERGTVGSFSMAKNSACLHAGHAVRSGAALYRRRPQAA